LRQGAFSPQKVKGQKKGWFDPLIAVSRSEKIKVDLEGVYEKFILADGPVSHDHIHGPQKVILSSPGLY
jgi:hypothetical protein